MGCYLILDTRPNLIGVNERVIRSSPIWPGAKDETWFIGNGKHPLKVFMLAEGILEIVPVDACERHLDEAGINKIAKPRDGGR
jgi:hypothetical protein